ncbi:MAG TPA: NADH-quinone oxidoreductase subunit J [Terracidiphilus sp.]
MTAAFWIITAITILGGVAAMMLRSVVHAALAVTVAFGGLALMFLNLGAQFAGFAQILVYIGAVAILVVFAILLTRGSETPRDAVFSKTWLSGLAIAAAVFAVLGWAILNSPLALEGTKPEPGVTVKDIGIALMGPYVLPLEIVAVLLTSALIGAVIVAMHDKEGAR